MLIERSLIEMYYSMKNQILPHMLFLVNEDSLLHSWENGMLDEQASYSSLRDWSETMLKNGVLKPYTCKSKKQIFNYSILNYDAYGLGIEDEDQMLRLLNIMEAHGETLEHINEDYSYIDQLSTRVLTPTEKAEFALETNQFYGSWNEYALMLLDRGVDSVEEFEQDFSSMLELTELALVTDGIVEMNIV